MIEYRKGNIFDSIGEVPMLVNTVNCKGVMGAGLAKQFKDRYPYYFKEYQRICGYGLVKLGSITHCNLRYGQLKRIINFPTKNHWKDKSRIEDIESGLYDLVRVMKSGRMKSVAIPPLGCGLGGLDWEVVKPMIVDIFTQEAPDIKVLIYDTA